MNLSFAWPWLLLLLPLPWLLRRWLTPHKRTGSALRVPVLAPFQELNRHTGSQAQGSRLALLLLSLVWVLLLIAAARPQLLGDPIGLPASGRDLMLAVDLSGSMNREDMQLEGRRATRLEVLKAAFDDFVVKREGDRVGLILFGSNAYLKAPLSFDLNTVNRLMQETPLGVAGPRTAIGDAIGLAVRHLRDRPAENRVLILLTDGANNSGELEPVPAAEMAAMAGIRIHTIGFGADQMEVANQFGGLFGSRIIDPSADMDEEAMIQVAEMTGGQYFRARRSEELSAIYGQLNELEPVPAPDQIFRPARSLFHWPLAIALILSLGWATLRSSVLQGGRAWTR